MTVRISKVTNIATLFDGSGNLISSSPDLISGTNPIKTEHSGDGQTAQVTLYLFNDAFRDQLNLDGSKRAMPLTYKSIKITIKGVSTTINSPGVTITQSATSIPVADASRYNKGTKLWLKNNQEQVLVNDVNGNNLIVERGINGTTVDLVHGDSVIADTTHVQLANESSPGSGIPATFGAGGIQLTAPDINDDKAPHAFFLKVTTGALPTQVKSDVYLEVTANEYPRVS